MKLHLISFKTCPFVQRAAITLKQKNVAHEITYIDLANPPDWFLELSPLGKVPVLKVDGEVLFESAVINEYLDEITGGELQPKDPLLRAKNRAWIEFASNMLGNSYLMKTATDKVGYEKYRDLIITQLQRVEERLSDGDWFNGDDFSLADTAFAPFFMHNSVANNAFSLIDPATMPKVDAWSKRLLALPAVKHSVVPEFELLYLQRIEKFNSYMWQQYAAESSNHG
ncbi:MAG: glutathione S-transferase family protein [Gammaproteobacteria bacterium]|nr:glutathione S-transferase family protein [Gammaproteobacteria bacterium]